MEEKTNKPEDQYSEDQILHVYYASKLRHLDYNYLFKYGVSQSDGMSEKEKNISSDNRIIQNDQTGWSTLTPEQRLQLLSRPQHECMWPLFPKKSNDNI